MSKKAYLNWTAETTAEVIRRYSVEMESPQTIAESFGCHRSSINNLLKENGIETRKTWSRTGRSAGLTNLDDEQVKQLVHEYVVEGSPIEHLATKYGVVPVTVRRKLIEAGVEMRPRGPARHAHIVDGRLNCIICHQDKPTSEFHADPGVSTGFNAACKICVRNRSREAALGVTEAQYNDMLASQGGGCAICGAEPETKRNPMKVLAVDHCHATGRIRGLLCSTCNKALGLMLDSRDLLEGAIAYIQEP